MDEPGAARRPGAFVVLGLLLLNLALLGGQAAFGKEAALRQESLTPAAVLGNPFYLATLGCLAGHAVIWPLILQRAPLGFAYAFSTLQYPLVLVLSRTLFGEMVTLLNVAGAVLIAGGVGLLSAATVRRG